MMWYAMVWNALVIWSSCTILPYPTHTGYPSALQAPTNHKSMSLEDRCENSLCGVVLLELFQLLAADETARRGLPRGSLFLAPETIRNLQHSAFGTIIASISKNDVGDPWKREHQLTELSIERWFGRLRSSSVNSQLTARSYWRAAARDMLLATRKNQADRAASEPPREKLKCLTPNEFYVASDRAYRGALRLAAFCADITAESLDARYRQWCDKQSYNEEQPLLGDEEECQDEEDQDEVINAGKTHEERILHTLQADAAMDAMDLDDVPKPQNESKSNLDFDVKDELYASILRGIVDPAEHDQASAEPVPPESPSKGLCRTPGLATTLFRSLWTLGREDGEQGVFDSIFRLVMFLRHWGNGSDRTWIKNPRLCRAKSIDLNWYQSLGFYRIRNCLNNNEKY